MQMPRANVRSLQWSHFKSKLNAPRNDQQESDKKDIILAWIALGHFVTANKLTPTVLR
jgi:hypothetical protein